MKELRMTEGAPWKHTLRFAMPVLAGALLQQMYNTVDTIIAGNYAGQSALAAVGTTGTFSFLFLSIALGFSAGAGVIVSQRYGAKDMEGVRRSASTGILMLLGMGIVCTILAMALARPAFIYFINVPSVILDMSMTYFLIFSAGMVFQFAYNIFASLLRAVGDSAATLYFLLISAVVNVVLDILFVAVFRWGVAGTAIATVISQIAAAAAAYIYMTKKYPIFRFRLKEYTWSGLIAKQTLKIGFPISLQTAVVSIGLAFIQRAVNDFGETMTASYTVAMRIEMYLNLPGNAFQTTLATYTGQNIGAGRIDRVRKGLWQTFVMSLGVTLIISACIRLFSGGLIQLFGLEEDAAALCIRHLHTTAFTNLLLNAYFPVFGVFQGSNHGLPPAIIAVAVLATRVVVTYALRYSALFGLSIIWWNGLFGFGVGFIITWIYYFSGKWEKNSMIAH
ncbi:MAG: MATE family efflux transporter [Oscillospiraceae bacterium]|nr:MATE family efflux transporter [Oscillospiraceae bacterium]